MPTSREPIVGAHVFDADVRVSYDCPRGLGLDARMVRVEVSAKFFDQDVAHAFERDVRALLENPK